VGERAVEHFCHLQNSVATILNLMSHVDLPSVYFSLGDWHLDILLACGHLYHIWTFIYMMCAGGRAKRERESEISNFKESGDFCLT
jgi:hypothetical protein